MLSNKEAVIQAVENSGEIGVAGLAERLRLDKGTVRKVALEAAREGRIGAWNDGQGYVFFPATNQAGQRFLRGAEPTNSGQSEPPVIDADFREIPPPPSSTGRALVPVGQPFDSRTEAAVRQHARAKALAARASQGHRIGGQFVSSLDQLFAVDPTGDFTLSAMERAEIAAEREALARERAEAEARAVATRPREPTTGELIGAAFKVAHEAFLIHQSLARQQAVDRTVTRERKPPAEPVADYFTTRRREWKETEESSPVRELLRRRAAAKTALPPPPADNRPWWKRLWDAAPPRKAVWR